MSSNAWIHGVQIGDSVVTIIVHRWEEGHELKGRAETYLDPRKALTAIYDILDDLVLDERFDDVDAALRGAELDRLDSSCILGLLGIAYAARDRLTEWESLVARARAAYEQRDMKPEKIDRLLGKWLTSAAPTAEGRT